MVIALIIIVALTLVAAIFYRCCVHPEVEAESNEIIRLQSAHEDEFQKNQEKIKQKAEHRSKRSDAHQEKQEKRSVHIDIKTAEEYNEYVIVLLFFMSYYAF